VVATFDIESDERQKVEVVIAHGHCAHSKVVALGFPFPGREHMSGGDPPALCITRQSGTRVAIIFERSIVVHRRPVLGGDGQNEWIADCLGSGLHLVLEPVLEFERAADSWLMAVGSPEPGFEIRGPEGKRLIFRDPIPPECLELLMHQRRCLLITGSTLLNSGLYGSPELTGKVLVEQLEQARVEGRVVGGVMPVEFAEPGEVVSEPHRTDDVRKRGWVGRRPKKTVDAV
jgi:hypothetical protein